VRQRFIESIQIDQRNAQADMRFDIPSVKLSGLAKPRNGFLRLFQFAQTTAYVAEDPGVLGVERSGAAIGHECFVKPILFRQKVAKLDPDDDEIRLEFKREMVALESFVKSALTLQQHPEIRKIVRVGWIVSDRLADQFNARLQPVGRGIDHAKQVQGIRMCRSGGQSLQAMLFGFIQQSRSKAFERHVIQGQSNTF